MNKQQYAAAAREYRTQHPTTGLITPPPENDNPLETHLRELWNMRFISGSRFDEAYQPVSMEYRLYQIYGRSVVASVLRDYRANAS